MVLRRTRSAPLTTLVGAILLTSSGCKSPPASPAATTNSSAMRTKVDAETDLHATRRTAMVADQIVARGVSDELVLTSMRTVPRHEFVPEDLRALAYHDRPLPIGHEQTISQPYIVAVMSEYLSAKPEQRVLEIGTGSGYQAAVLAQMRVKVFSIEIVCPLHDEARERLDRLGYGDAVISKCGDGYAGWQEHAPFDAVIVTAAPPQIPQALIDQLAPGGRLIAPEGQFDQDLVLIKRAADGTVSRDVLFGVRFVPMVRAQSKPQ